VAQESLKEQGTGLIELGILGPLEARREGAPVHLGAAKQRALLAILLLRPNEVVSRDRLIDELWGNEPPETAAHALEVYVSNLRRALGREALTTRAGGYALTVSPEAVDAVRFETLVERGRSELARDAGTAAETLRAALALWRGPALVDVAYEAFAQSEIARLDELRLVAIENRIEADLRLGRHAQLIAELEAEVDEHPLRERLRGQLMLALYRSGRQADALESYRDARERLLEELGLEPSGELRELQGAILRHDPALDVEPAELRARRHLPASPTPFIGRREELANVLARFRDESARLVTLTGPGGIGKTRLALQAAHELAADYLGGVYFVDLAPVTDAGMLGGTIATALGIEDTVPLEEYLAQRRLLLVLDNFEHIDPAASAVAELLRRAAQASVLVTSRSPLRIYGEHVVGVPPLATDDATTLFIERSLAAGKKMEPSTAIHDLCDWLDRLPLAIELVAARARELPPDRILAELPQRLDVAAGGPRDAPARQRTLRATIEWSYGLLEERERVILGRVAVFTGGFAPDSACAVSGAQLSELAALTAASLIVELETPGVEPRLGLLESVREFALDRLDEFGEASSLRRPHAQHFLELAERAEPQLGGSAAHLWLERLELEHDNLRAALDWAARTGTAEEELRIAVALRRFWLVRGHVREGQRRLEDALARSDEQPAPLRATASGAAGAFAVARGEHAKAKTWTEESLQLFRSLGDKAGVAHSLSRLADIAKAEDDAQAASRYYALALEVARELEDKRPLAAVLTNAGAFALMRGDFAEAERQTREALSIWRDLGHAEAVAIALSNLGIAAIERNAFAEATPYVEEGFKLARGLGFRSQLAHAVGVCATVAARTSAPERAARLVAAADQMLEAIDAKLSPHGQMFREEAIAAFGAALTETQLAEATDAGCAMSVDEVVSYALETLRLAPAGSETAGGGYR
jgi:predicted ATPase/DNA-binding SARP family transcriptional activator/Tfp pilus assembly protein PilF